MPPQPRLATAFRALHRPGHPVVLANVYDILSARAVGELPSCNALATASYGVARANGTTDDDMTLETNVGACRGIAGVAAELGKPLTVDAQDGYGARLEELVGALVGMGVVGVNLEDCDKETGKMMEVGVAAQRVERVLKAAEKAGVGEFVVNARCDTLVNGGTLEETIERGKAYLAAGATTVFVWGGSKRGVKRDEVAAMVKAFNGRLNVSLVMAPGHLTVRDLAEIGVARISVGPQIQFTAMKKYADEAEGILKAAS